MVACSTCSGVGDNAGDRSDDRNLAANRAGARIARTPRNLRLSDNLIDLMEDVSLSSAQGIGRALGDTTAPVNALRRALRAMVKSLCPGRRSTNRPRPLCAPTR